jgi:hypothetical protein
MSKLDLECFLWLVLQNERMLEILEEEKKRVKEDPSYPEIYFLDELYAEAPKIRRKVEEIKKMIDSQIARLNYISIGSTDDE